LLFEGDLEDAYVLGLSDFSMNEGGVFAAGLGAAHHQIGGGGSACEQSYAEKQVNNLGDPQGLHGTFIDRRGGKMSVGL
jgi:hypothetical protein